MVAKIRLLLKKILLQNRPVAFEKGKHSLWKRELPIRTYDTVMLGRRLCAKLQPGGALRFILEGRYQRSASTVLPAELSLQACVRKPDHPPLNFSSKRHPKMLICCWSKKWFIALSLFSFLLVYWESPLARFSQLAHCCFLPPAHKACCITKHNLCMPDDTHTHTYTLSRYVIYVERWHQRVVRKTEFGWGGWPVRRAVVRFVPKQPD